MINDETLLSENPRIVKNPETSDFYSTAIPNLRFLPLPLAVLTLPYNQITDTVWSRENKNFKLWLSAGYNEQGDFVGLPYGVMSRRILYYLFSEAVTKKNRCVTLGKNYTEILQNLGVIESNQRAGGAHIKRFTEHLERLATCSMQITGMAENNTHTTCFYESTKIIERCVYITSKSCREESTIQINISQKMYNYLIKDKHIPFLARTLQLCNGNAVVMDLYILFNLKAFSASTTNKNVFVAFKELHRSLGTTSSYKNFIPTLKKSLAKLANIQAKLDLSISKKGVWVSRKSQSDVLSKHLYQQSLI